MNKTVSCNISGIIFNLEEKAYQILHNYLDNLKAHLEGNEGSEEIYTDIEMRIAELFTATLKGSKQVVTELDVKDVIETMGRPEDYVEDDQSEEKQKSEFEQSGDSQYIRKEFMRDPENGMIGGVCTGAAAYFGLDLTLVRAIFVLLFFLPGFGGLLYIVLWIIAPVAKTNSDRLRMRGEPINVDSIKREVKDAAQRVGRFSKNRFKKEKVETMKGRTNRIGRSLGSIFGLLLIIGGVMGIITFLMVTLSEIGIFTSEDGEQLISLYEFSSVIFNTAWQSFIGWSGLLGTVIIPLLTIIVIGVSLMLHIRSQWVKYTLTFFLIIWFFAMGALGIAGFQIGREFTHLGEREESIGVVSNQHLTIHVPSLYDGMKYQSTQININNGHFHGSLMQLEDKSVKSGLVSLKFQPSEDSLFHVIREKSAYGITHRKALRLTANIDHKVSLEDSLLTIYPFYHFPRADKLRAQHVTVYVKVPKNGTIKWSGNKKQLHIDEQH